MDSLASSDPPPLPPTNLPPYVVFHSNFNATKKSHTESTIQTILKSSKNSHCYHKYVFTTAYFCIIKQKKMKQTNWTQMLDKKSTNTPLLSLIFACTLTLKRVFNEFLEAQLRRSKGVFVLFLLNIWVQLVFFMLSNERCHDFKSYLLVFLLHPKYNSKLSS